MIRLHCFSDYGHWMICSGTSEDGRYQRFTAHAPADAEGRYQIEASGWTIRRESYLPFVEDYRDHGTRVNAKEGFDRAQVIDYFRYLTGDRLLGGKSVASSLV